MEPNEIARLVELIKKGPKVNSTALLDAIRGSEDTQTLLILKCAIMAYDAVQNGLLVEPGPNK